MDFRRYIAVSLWVVSFFFAGHPPAVAADGKHYPATICQYWSADENANRNRMIVSQFGRVGRNLNTTGANRRLGIVCPLLRDSMRSGIERVFVRAIHRACANNGGHGHPCPGNTECTFRVMHGNGDNVRSEIGPTAMLRADNSQQATAFMDLDITNIPVPDYTSSADLAQGSTFVLFCQLAPGAELTSIYVGEGTD